MDIPYFLGYNTDFFSFQTIPKIKIRLYKIDLDFWDCFGRKISRCLEMVRKGKTCIIANFHRADLVICSHSREGKILSFS